MRLPNITILIGAPASGKSTWARQQVQQNYGTVIISRDELRKEMFGYTDDDINLYYQDRSALSSKEAKVSKELESRLRRAIRKGNNVIMDNTHCKLSYIRAYTKFYATLDVEYFDVDIIELIQRNSNRAASVPANVIKSMHAQFTNLDRAEVNNVITEHNSMMTNFTVNNDDTKKPCIIFDIDGTVAHNTYRSPYDYSKVLTDTVDSPVWYISRALVEAEGDPEILFVSGRDDCCYDDTKKWLDAHQFYYADLIMRKTGDTRPDWIIKQEIWKEITKDYYIVCMYDDRDQVVDRARQLGLKSIQVAPGDF